MISQVNLLILLFVTNLNNWGFSLAGNVLGGLWVGLASLLLSLDQSSLLLGDFTNLIVFGGFPRSFLSGAFVCRLIGDGLALLLNLFLHADVLFELSDVLGEVLVDHGHGTVLLRVEVRLASEEAEQGIEKAFNALRLLDGSHK